MTHGANHGFRKPQWRLARCIFSTDSTKSYFDTGLGTVLGLLEGRVALVFPAITERIVARIASV